MKFSNERPPVMDRLEKTFGVKWGGGLVVAYGDTIHHTEPLTPDLIIHEHVHLYRQNNNSFALGTKYADEWWSKYINDSKFRLAEELLAYRQQYMYIKDIVTDRNVLAVNLMRLAKDLSGMYKLPISQSEAMRLIKAQ